MRRPSLLLAALTMLLASRAAVAKLQVGLQGCRALVGKARRQLGESVQLPRCTEGWATGVVEMIAT